MEKNAMTEARIDLERDDTIAIVTIHRPAKLNALTRTLWRELGDTIEALSADDALRCIVLRGAGEKAFSPGNDIGEFETERSNVEQAREYGALMHVKPPQPDRHIRRSPRSPCRRDG